MKLKEKLTDVGTWIIVSVFVGYLLGYWVAHITVKPEIKLSCPHNILTPDEACKLFYDCEFGFGSLGNLNCYCNGSWKRFGYKEFSEVVNKLVK